MRFTSVREFEGVLEFLDVDGQVIGRMDKESRGLAELPERRSIRQQPRWKDGSYLTEQQRKDEEYQSRMGIR